MITFVRTVRVGSLASCRGCGGLLVTRDGGIRHLTGDEAGRPCGLAERLREDRALFGQWLAEADRRGGARG